MIALEVDAPVIGYADAVPVLRDVSLRVDAGTVVALLGGNGVGKTVLLRWIAGLAPRGKGRCVVHGRTIARPRDAVANAVGLVVQDPNDQLLGATVREDLELGPRNLGWSAARRAHHVEAAMDAVGVTSLADREIETLSLGERKRVSLGGVLAMAPRLLLLDEPTAGLDPAAQRSLCDILRNLAEGGVTQLVATHAVDLVPRFATRVVVLGEGRVMADGPCREVLTQDEMLGHARLRRPWPTELWARAFASRMPEPALTLEEVLPLCQMRSC